MNKLILLLSIYFSWTYNLTAQCNTAITIQQMVTLQSNFSLAEDLLLDCYWKSKVEEVQYKNGDKGKHWSWTHNTRVSTGTCTAPKNSISFYVYNKSIIYTTRNTQEYLEKKKFIRANGTKTTVPGLDDAEAYEYKGLAWAFYIDTNEGCNSNNYCIFIQ